MLSFSSVPFLFTTRNLQNSVADIRKSFQTAQYESVNGRVEDLAKHLEGDIGKVHQVDKLIRLSEKRKEALAATSSEFEIVQLTLGSMREAGAEIAIAIDSAIGLNNETSITANAQKANSELQSIFGQLNTSFGGKNLFSGAAVDTAPLADFDTMMTDLQVLIAGGGSLTGVNTALDTYFGPAGVFETTIYQGSTTASGPTREIAEGRRVGVDVTPLDAGVLGAIRGLAMVALAPAALGDSTLRDAVLESASDQLGAASQELHLKQTELGTVQEDLALLTSRNEATTLLYKTNRIALVGRNEYEAASEMANIETQLEAAYLATSRIANLSLANYLG